MATNPKLCVAMRNLALNAALDSLGTGATMNIYSGTQPTDADTALGAQVLLASLPMTSTPFGAASSGSKTAAAITSASAVATGTAAWGSLVTSGSVRKRDFSVGTATSDLIVNSVAFSSGATVSCSSWVETMAV